MYSDPIFMDYIDRLALYACSACSSVFEDELESYRSQLRYRN